MAFELHRPGLQIALYAASNIAERTPVKLSASSINQVVPVGSSAERPFGFVDAVASRLDHVTVYEEGNYIKARAAASVAYGAPVAVASANGALGPITGGPTALASGAVAWEIGEAFSNAAAGGVFTVRVRIRPVTG